VSKRSERLTFSQSPLELRLEKTFDPKLAIFPVGGNSEQSVKAAQARNGVKHRNPICCNEPYVAENSLALKDRSQVLRSGTL
jgi:hypothetical protein